MAKKNRFSILRTSAILSLQIFIFGRVAVVSFIICYHHQSELVGDVAVPMSARQAANVCQISSKSDDFSRRYSVLTIFKMAAVRHLEFVVTS